MEPDRGRHWNPGLHMHACKGMHTCRGMHTHPVQTHVLPDTALQHTFTHRQVHGTPVHLYVFHISHIHACIYRCLNIHMLYTTHASPTIKTRKVDEMA